MEDFFKHFKDRWPAGSREGHCLSYDGKQTTCRHKEGNPFGPFWTHFGVDFDSFQPYSLPHGLDQRTARAWNSHFSPSKVWLFGCFSPNSVSQRPCSSFFSFLFFYQKGSCFGAAWGTGGLSSYPRASAPAKPSAVEQSHAHQGESIH